jgi:cytochrome c oxidase assembly protein subunit 15
MTQPLTLTRRAGSRLLPVATDAQAHRAATAVCWVLGLVVVTGAAVRLTGSGLGCPTWPTCTADSIHSGLTFHGLIEFGNRIISAGVFLAGVVVLAWLVARAGRRDCAVLIGLLFGGYLAEAVLGGLTVLTRLNPLLVATHLLLALGLLWDALLLRDRLSHPPAALAPRVRAEVAWLSRALVAGAGAVIVVGTLVTGTGPWAGSRVDNRLPFDRRAITQLHSDLVLLLAGGVVVLVVLLRVVDAPADVRRRGSWVLGLLVGQASVGFLQYATGLPGWLIEVHVAGATAFWASCLLLAMSARAPALPTVPTAGGSATTAAALTAQTNGAMATARNSSVR